MQGAGARRRGGRAVRGIVVVALPPNAESGNGRGVDLCWGSVRWNLLVPGHNDVDSRVVK